ncbi:hypothetical protein D3C72_1899670 [compost metagenome]
MKGVSGQRKMSGIRRVEGVAHQRGSVTVMVESRGTRLRCFQWRHTSEQCFQSGVRHKADQCAAFLPITFGQCVDHLGNRQMQNRQLPHPLRPKQGAIQLCGVDQVVHATTGRHPPRRRFWRNRALIGLTVGEGSHQVAHECRTQSIGFAGPGDDARQAQHTTVHITPPG